MQIQILNESKKIYEGQAEFVSLPSSQGEIGILPMHAKMISVLTSGEIQVRQSDSTKTFQINGGYVKVASDLVEAFVII